MKYGFDLMRITKLLVDFYKVTGQRVGIFDADYRLISVYPEQLSEYCALVRSRHDGVRRCVECDRNGMLKAKKTGKDVIYRCHAGMLEVCAPITDQGQTVGYVMFGQIIYDTDVESQHKLALEKSFGLISDKSAAVNALKKTRTVSKSYIEAVSNIMNACIGYIRMEQLMRIEREGLWGQINAYINNNISGTIRLDDMAKSLSVSIATLCKTAKRHTEKTIGQLVLQKRIELAKDLLYSSDLAVSEISERVGIADYNYFSRVFRREVGVTPRQYRKNGPEPKSADMIFKNFY